jgi:hypothetical protein
MKQSPTPAKGTVNTNTTNIAPAYHFPYPSITPAILILAA